MAMAAHPTNLSENPIRLREFRKNHQKTNGISFWAFLLSIFIYISIFYIFNLSPLNLLSSTRFWFFISNTLILIIAADFDAFFSSRESDFFQDYLKTAGAKSACTFSPPFEGYMQRRNMVEKKNTQEKVIREITPPEEIKCVVVLPRGADHAAARNELECDSFQEVNSLQVKAQNPVQHGGKKREAKRARRNSEVEIHFAENEEEKKNNGLQRSQSERYNLKNIEENNEFSDMSVEELNRRVEEFIQRFNRQIRLQAASRKLHN